MTQAIQEGVRIILEVYSPGSPDLEKSFAHGGRLFPDGLSEVIQKVDSHRLESLFLGLTKEIC
jgi:hypothetical protein